MAFGGDFLHKLKELFLLGFVFDRLWRLRNYSALDVSAGN